MNYREKIRKAIECPQLGNETYGELGILNPTQRKYIKRLLDELDNADNFVKKLYFENKQLKDNWNKLKEYIISTRYEYGDLDQDLEDYDLEIEDVLDKIQELENGDSNEI